MIETRIDPKEDRGGFDPRWEFRRVAHVSEITASKGGTSAEGKGGPWGYQQRSRLTARRGRPRRR